MTLQRDPRVTYAVISYGAYEGSGRDPGNLLLNKRPIL